jgi:hypothetical protein
VRISSKALDVTMLSIGILAVLILAACSLYKTCMGGDDDVRYMNKPVVLGQR